MRVPTEEDIDAVISETKANSSQSHDDSDHDCEFCSWNKELSSRQEKLDQPVLIDDIARSVVEGSPQAMMLATLFGQMLIPIFAAIARSAFFFGMKAGRNQVMAEKMEE